MITKEMILEAAKQSKFNGNEKRTWKLSIDGDLYASPKGDFKAIQAQVGNIVGHSSDSNIVKAVVSDLIHLGTADAYHKGNKVVITLEAN